MSWFKKAEELLNIVDQSAAQALNKSENEQSPGAESSHKRNSSTSFDNMRFEPSVSGSSTPSGTRSISKRNKEDDLIDYLNSTEANGGDQRSRTVRKFDISRMTVSYSETSGGPSSVKSASGSDSDMNVSSSGPAVKESNVSNGLENEEVSEQQVAAATGEETEKSAHTDAASEVEPMQAVIEEHQQEPVVSKLKSEEAVVTSQQQSANDNERNSKAKARTNRNRLNAFEEENKLLKQEIDALNRECTSLIERGRAEQSDREAQRSEMAKVRSTVSAFERRIRELEATLSDAQEALRAKDTQIGVLKVRLEEAEGELANVRNGANMQRNENEAAMRDFSQATALKDSAIDSLAAQVRELDAALKSERAAHEAALHDAADSTRSVETERNALTAQLNELNRRVSDERFRASELSRQLLVAKHASDSLRDELDAYREKAQMLVSTKERVIAQLAATLQQHGISQLLARSDSVQRSAADSGSPSPNSDADSGAGVSLSSLLPSNLSLSSEDMVSLGEFEAMRNERDALREELRSVRCAVDQLRADLQDAEAQSDAERRTLQDTVTSLEQQLNVARAHASECDAEMRAAQRSAACAQDELHKQTLQSRARLADRENEIERLRAQVLTQQRSPAAFDSAASHFSSLTTTSNENETGDRQGELMSRVRALTENLIAKQTLVETLQTDKQTLRVQLERANERYADLQRFANSNGNSNNARSRGTTDLHTNVTVYDETSSNGTTSASLATFDYDDVVRRRLPLPAFMRESLSRDTKLTRNMRKAVTNLDVFSIRLGLFLRRYPIARVFLLCYICILHLWVFIVLTTYQHEIHTSADLTYAPHNVQHMRQPIAHGNLPPLPQGIVADNQPVADRLAG